MKTLLLSLLAISLFSCSNDDCSGSRDSIEQQYYTAVANCGGSTACAQNATNQYEKRLENACD